MKFNALDVVVLQQDVPSEQLKRGDLGTVVDVLGSDAIEVEFVTAAGDTQALLTLKPSDVRAVAGDDVVAVRSLGSAA